MILYLAAGSVGDIPAAAAGGDLAGTPTNILTSYHYCKSIPIAEIRELCKGEIVIDSGAFSAMSLGAEIRVEDYAEYLLAGDGANFRAFNLDVVRDHKRTAENQARLEAYGLAPIPVFHIGSPWSALEELAERYDYVGLGGMVGASPKTAVHRWINQCFRKFPNIGFHGLGQTSTNVMAAFPWRSVDSSTWLSPARWGSMPIHRNGTITAVGFNDLTQRDRVHLRELGIDLANIDSRAPAARRAKLAASAVAYIEMQQHLTKRRAK